MNKWKRIDNPTTDRIFTMVKIVLQICIREGILYKQHQENTLEENKFISTLHVKE